MGTPVTNFGKVTVSTTYGSGDTSIVLTTGHGSRLPSTFPYPLTWWDATTYSDPADDPNKEIVIVTGRTGDTLTVTRAGEGTSASTKNTGSKTYKMVLSITKAMWDGLGIFTTGDVKMTLKTVADTAWVLMDDKTIGNAASGGTGRANADTVDLYTLLWTNCADAQCPVSTGRGASAAADYAANKTLKLPVTLGRALACYGAGSGLTSRVLGLATGVETHVLSTAEMPVHTHMQNTYTTGTGVGTGTTSTVNIATPGDWQVTDATGSGGAHQNMQPTVFLNVMIKL